MSSFIFKPSANGFNVLTNAVGVEGLDPGETAAVAPGTYHVYQRVLSGVVVANSAWTPASLGAKLFAWYDFTSPSYVFSDAAGTVPVTNGDQIRRVSDRSGNGRDLSNAVSVAADQSWDGVNNQASFNGETSSPGGVNQPGVGLDGIANLTGATSTMEVYFLIKTADGCANLFGHTGGASNFYGALINDANAANPNGLIGGSVTYHSNNGAALTVPTADDMHTQLADNVARSLCMRNADLTGFNSAQTMRLFNNFPQGRGLGGQVTHVVMTNAAMTTAERTDLQTWAATSLPV